MVERLGVWQIFRRFRAWVGELGLLLRSSRLGSSEGRKGLLRGAGLPEGGPGERA